MTRDHLFRAAELARAAADAATIAASFDRIKPDQAERYARQSEEALYAAIEALFEARLTTPGPVRPVMAEILSAFTPMAERQAQSLERAA